MFATPDISHLKAEDYDKVYEPAEDTFLLLDALEKDYEFLRTLDPLVCLEVGCGSGIVSAYASHIFGSRCWCICTDINPAATIAARRTAEQNNITVCPLMTDLVSGLLPRLQKSVDVIIFNPPYVVTPSEEVGSRSIEASWAGGRDGREVTDRLLSSIPNLMSPKAAFYLVAIKENKPEEIGEILAGHGITRTLILERRSGPERLSVHRFTWKEVGDVCD